MTARADAAILLVEDDELNRVLTTAMLRALGYLNVRAVVNGSEAVQACTEQRFDLILMDCDMPVMNGLDATRAIRRLDVCTPIVAYTASVTLANKARCIEAGMSDFLPKPTDAAQLVRKLHDWLA